MKRLLTFLVILALIGYLSFKGAVWWLADQRLADAQQAIEELGVIDRGNIRSDLVGRLVLGDGSYQDFRLTRPVAFDRLMFNAGSPVALVRALLDPADLPPHWSLVAENLSLGLDTNMFRNWVTAAGDATPALFSPVCGPDHRQQLGSGDLMRLGVDGVSGEAMVIQSGDGLYAELTTERRQRGIGLARRSPESPVIAGPAGIHAVAGYCDIAGWWPDASCCGLLCQGIGCGNRGMGRYRHGSVSRLAGGSWLWRQ